jgi:hypothetical protein
VDPSVSCNSCSDRLKELRALRQFVRDVNKAAGRGRSVETLAEIADSAGMVMEQFGISGDIWRQGSDEPVGRVR